MDIWVVNESTVLSDAEIEAALPAFQTQCWHVKAWWGKFAVIKFGKPPVENVWQIVVLDDSDQEGALGYHDYTPGKRPISKIFAKTDEQYGYNWTVTLSHELCEMLVDPWINSANQVTDTQFYALEVGDPVEADEFGYPIKTRGGHEVIVSDFILPYWFWQDAKGQYDYKGHCTEPLQILEGGYMSIYEEGRGWTQVTQKNGQLVEVPLDEKGQHTRPVKYGRAR